MTLGSPSPVLVVNNRPAPVHEPEHSVRGTSRSEVFRPTRPESVDGGVQNVLTARRATPPAPAGTPLRRTEPCPTTPPTPAPTKPPPAPSPAPPPGSPRPP